MSDFRIDSVCRTCLAETDELRSLFREGKVCGEITTLSDMLVECTALEINQDDPLPQHICNKCVLSLSKAYMFRRTCTNSDSVLRDRIKIKQPDEDEVVSTLYFYDEAESDSIVEECGDQIQYECMELKHDNDACESNVACEEETIECGQYEQIEIAEDSGTNEREYNTSPESSYTVEIAEINQKQFEMRVPRKRAQRVPGPPFKCNECEKILSNHSSYKYHMQLHSDKTPYLCSECGEGFKTRNAYEGHMTTHDENNPNKCEICGKVYRQAGSLRSHMLNHTGEKPFQCKICGKGMTQKSGYKKHMLTHTGEKPHKCDICGSSFRFSSNLITHRRRHTGEKPYVCETCGKAFAGGEQLKRHLSVHTGEKLFKCEICSKVCNRRSALQLHYAHQHSGEKKCTCRVCGETFSQMKALVNHMAIHKECYEEVGMVGQRQDGSSEDIADSGETQET